MGIFLSFPDVMADLYSLENILLVYDYVIVRGYQFFLGDFQLSKKI
jgi:hypothetical protein